MPNVCSGKRHYSYSQDNQIMDEDYNDWKGQMNCNAVHHSVLLYIFQEIFKLFKIFFAKLCKRNKSICW